VLDICKGRPTCLSVFVILVESIKLVHYVNQGELVYPIFCKF
jgi:hypothetical protein